VSRQLTRVLWSATNALLFFAILLRQVWLHIDAWPITALMVVMFVYVFGGNMALYAISQIERKEGHQ
jgi:hypothetical protein